MTDHIDIIEVTDDNAADCARCSTCVGGDPSRFGTDHAEFTCPHCGYSWTGSID